MTTAAAEEYKLVLSVGDTTFLDYRSINSRWKILGKGDRQLKIDF